MQSRFPGSPHTGGLPGRASGIGSGGEPTGGTHGCARRSLMTTACARSSVANIMINPAPITNVGAEDPRPKDNEEEA